MHQFEQMFTASIYLLSTTFGQRFTCASTNLHSNKRSNFEVRTNNGWGMKKVLLKLNQLIGKIIIQK